MAKSLGSCEAPDTSSGLRSNVAFPGFGPARARETEQRGRNMNRRFSSSVLVGVLTVVGGVGCGSDSGGASPELIPHLAKAGGLSLRGGGGHRRRPVRRGQRSLLRYRERARPPDSTTAALTFPEDGKVCIQGTVAPGGYAYLVLWFTEYNALQNYDITAVLKPFDAVALGITQVAFSIDSPPSNGVTVQATILKQLDCPAGGNDCRTSGFALVDAPNSGVQVVIKDPGTVVAPFANFEQTDRTMSAVFDTAQLDAVIFTVIKRTL